MWVFRLAAAHGVPAERDHVGVVHEAVADRVRDCRVAQGFVPSFRRQLRRDDGGAAVIAVFQHFEQVAALGVFHWREKKVVEDQYVDLRKTRECRAVGAGGARDGELFSEPRHASKKCAESLATSCLRKRRRQIAFANAGRPEQDHVLMCFHPLARAQLSQLRLVDAATWLTRDVFDRGTYSQTRLTHATREPAIFSVSPLTVNE